MKCKILDPRFFLGLVLFVISFATTAQPIATSFSYPVGDPNIAPTEVAGNANGFKISQNFNTGVLYGGSKISPDGGWCNNPNKTLYTSRSSCESAGFRWIWGHTGVDLSNQSCGSQIKATADGVVEFSKTYFGYGNLLKIRHTLPNGRTVWSLYGHRSNDPVVNLTVGQVVTQNQVVGYVGNTGGVPCHLHFAIFDQAMPIAQADAPVGYVSDDNTGITSAGNPFPKNILRYFYDPLLFVSDRNKRFQTVLPGTGYWAVSFSNNRSVTTRTVYAATNAGAVKGLLDAVVSGWMYPDVTWYDGSSWHYYASNPLDSFILFAGNAYGFGAKRSDLTLKWFEPGNEYRDARWRGDMAEFTTVNAGLGFKQPYRETYGNNPNWTSSHGLAQIDYDQVKNGEIRRATVFVAYSRTDPLVRYVSYYDRFTSASSQWVRVY